MIWTRQNATGSSYYELSLAASLISQLFTAIGVAIAIGVGRENPGVAALAGGPFMLVGLLFGAFFFSLVAVRAEEGQVQVERFGLFGKSADRRPASDLKAVEVESKLHYDKGHQKSLVHRVVLRFAGDTIALADQWESYRPAVEARAARLAGFLGVASPRGMPQ